MLDIVAAPLSGALVSEWGRVLPLPTHNVWWEWGVSFSVFSQ